MSVILSEPRRASPVALAALSEIDRALGSGNLRRPAQHAGSIAHAVLSVRLQRLLWRRLIGLSFLIFHTGETQTSR